LFSLWSFSDSDRQCFSFFGLTISRRAFYAQFESWGFYTASPQSGPSRSVMAAAAPRLESDPSWIAMNLS
jgi:hypothetical protein